MKYLRYLTVCLSGLFAAPELVLAQSDAAAPTQPVFYPMLLAISCLVLAAVFCVVFYSILKHRSSPEYKDSPFRRSLTTEAFWTVIPFLLVIGMLIPALWHVFK